MYEGLAKRHLIRDDEVAMKFCTVMKPWRARLRLTGREVARMIGGFSHGIISFVEQGEGGVSWVIYNKIADFMRWPKYEPNRKWYDWARDHPGMTDLSRFVNFIPEELRGDRQKKIDFSAYEVSPAEGLLIWLKSLDEELMGYVRILSSFYDAPASVIVTQAIKAYVSQHKDIIEHERLHLEYRDKVRRGLQNESQKKNY